MKFFREWVVLILILFCSIAYAGEKTWYKDVTQEEANQDVNECKYEATKNSPPSDSIFSSDSSLAGAMFSGMQQGGRTAELYSMCMKSKGYVIVEQPKKDTYTDWYNPKLSREERLKDYEACRKPFKEDRSGDYYRSCLQSKGYILVTQAQFKQMESEKAKRDHA